MSVEFVRVHVGIHDACDGNRRSGANRNDSRRMNAHTHMKPTQKIGPWPGRRTSRAPAARARRQSWGSALRVVV